MKSEEDPKETAEATRGGESGEMNTLFMCFRCP